MTTIPPNVLHIDDSEDDLALFARAVRAAAVTWNLTGVASASEALLLLNRIGPFDRLSMPRLVVCDLDMPVMDGLELLGIFARSALFRRMRVVVLTGEVSAERKERCLAQGACAVFAKPHSERDAAVLIRDMSRFLLEPDPTDKAPILRS